MKKRIFNCLTNIKAFFIAVLFALNLLFFPIFILILGAIAYIMPSKVIKQKIFSLIYKIPSAWTVVNGFFMRCCVRKKWNVIGPDVSDLNHNYIVICNHQSWVDIGVLTSLFSRKLPMFRFFMKKELLWGLPFASWACYILGFPFLSRVKKSKLLKKSSLRNKDLSSTKRACMRLRKMNSTLVSFSEGTRFSIKKKSTQQSAYQYLLKPKAGGLAIVLKELGADLKGVVNATIVYAGAKPTAWNFLRGEISDIIVRYEIIPAESIIVGDYKNTNDKKAFQNWLNKLWFDKDHLIGELIEEQQKLVEV